VPNSFLREHSKLTTRGRLNRGAPDLLLVVEKRENMHERNKPLQRPSILYQSPPNPALLRLRELDTMAEMAKSGNARLYLGFKEHDADEG